MPSGESVKQMEDDVLVDKQQIEFYLLVDFVWQVDAAHVGWPWLRPRSADSASVDDFWDEVKNFVFDPYSL